MISSYFINHIEASINFPVLKFILVRM